MKIGEFLCPKAVTTDLKGANKKEVIQEMVGLLVSAGTIEKKNKLKLVETLLAREALGSTAIGQGVAIPHGKCDFVGKMTAALGVSRKGVDFDSLDGEPAYIFFLLVAPTDSAGPHLKALAKISHLLKDKYFRENIKQMKDDKLILKLIAQEDERTP
ncbi:MAG TPA: PTS sugar transporter subunit IIA [Candidatus Omnitrophota bacterium]|nr:PTS sugar transporter subunit IIA [Candidatus Omnitrophota bacterium]HPD84956.1 PTS sugar transporter subunit IIA [Candidatus Omnitrophota bacterium]HRZ03814.1 PTS sugar transporter subunit IIA [Candidatus Omnitrophota bacterium]